MAQDMEQGAAAMAQPLTQQQYRQDEDAPVMRQGAEDFPTVSTPDQSNVPHHAAIDPAAPDAAEQSAQA